MNDLESTSALGLMPRVTLIWAALHLGMILKGMLMLGVGPQQNWVGAVASFYQRMSGTHYKFSFFAPSVDTEIRAVIHLEGSAGDSVGSFVLGEVDSAEVKLRVNGVVNTLRDPTLAVDLKRAVLASWASHAFAKYPGASTAQITLQTYYLPPLDGVSAQGEARWITTEEFKFTAGVT